MSHCRRGHHGNRAALNCQWKGESSTEAVLGGGARHQLPDEISLFVCPFSASRGPLGDIHTLSVCSYRTREGHSDITAVLFGQFLSGLAVERAEFSPLTPSTTHPTSKQRAEICFRTFTLLGTKKNWRRGSWRRCQPRRGSSSGL